MKSTFWNVVIFCSLAMGLIVGCSSEQGTTGDSATETTPGDSGTGESFVIGALDSLTGLGESYGVPLSQSKLLAVEEINAAGGINGRTLKLVVEDSKCTARGAISSYRRLTDVEGVKIVLGATCSGATLGVAPLAEEDGVVLLSPASTSPDITHAGDFIFRTAISASKVGGDIGNTLWTDGIRRIGTITEATDYAEGVRRTAVAVFEKLGGTVAAEESYPSEQTDFRTLLTKIKNENPDAVMISPQSEASAGTIVKQLRELGYDGPLYADVVTTGPGALSISGAAATGLKAVVPNPDLTTTAGKELLENYRARFGVVAPWPWFQGSAYDDVYITAECLRQTDDDQDSEGFRDCLYGLTWSGAIGDGYSFDENGDVVGVSHVIIEVLPLVERTEENLGYRILGQPSRP